MKNTLLISALLVTSIITKSQNKKLEGMYLLKTTSKYQVLSDKNYSSLHFNKDGTFVLNRAVANFTPVVEQCSYASKGKWHSLGNEAIEITSENYYTKQKGYQYNIIKENNSVQDSLYIMINLPKDLPSMKAIIIFNYKKDNPIIATDFPIILSKSEYLWKNNTPINNLQVRLEPNISGEDFIKYRIGFDIVNENINTDKYNSLTINFPFFDQCFLYFEPYYKELIFIKNNKHLYWQGETWVYNGNR